MYMYIYVYMNAYTCKHIYYEVGVAINAHHASTVEVSLRVQG